MEHHLSRSIGHTHYGTVSSGKCNWNLAWCGLVLSTLYLLECTATSQTSAKRRLSGVFMDQRKHRVGRIVRTDPHEQLV